MSALLYLTRTRVKNSLKEAFHHPSKLILYLLMVAMLVLVFISSQKSSFDPDSLRDIREFHAMALGLLLTIYLLCAYQGFRSGASFYSMADVNLLFQTPLPPKGILVYGLVRQMGTSLLMGLFLLFQFSWLHDLYGITLGALLGVLLCYALALFCAQITAVALYSYLGTNSHHRTLLKGIFFLLVGGIALYFLLPLLLSQGDPLTTLVERMDQPATYFLPIGGWLLALERGLLSGQWGLALAGVGGTMAFCLLILWGIGRSNTDYYEDVLQATEVSYNAINASKEGKTAEAVPQKVRVGRKGLGKGRGANTFYFKHRLENRRSRLLLLDPLTLIFVSINIIISFFMRDAGMLPIFAFVIYLQLFSVSSGRWARELLLPYVYLSPQPPFRKLVMICLESLEKNLVQGVVTFVPIGLIVGADLPTIVCCIAAHLGYSVLFMACTLLLERLFGSVQSKGLIFFLFFLETILLALPGIILAFVVFFLWNAYPWVENLAILSTLVWNLLVGALIAFLCRNILNYAELNNR